MCSGLLASSKNISGVNFLGLKYIIDIIENCATWLQCKHSVNVKEVTCLCFHKNNDVFCSEQNENASNAILASVNKTLGGSFDIHYSGNHSVRIITGMEEATSGWVTVNYLNQTFKPSYVSSNEYGK